MTCKLCGEERKLSRSHVIPEFFYTPIYDDKHVLHERDRQSGEVQSSQKGHREPLLCEECEAKFSRHERYFKTAWYDQGILPSTPNPSQEILTGLDYKPFKLCLLSILWRASVAKQPLFSHVRLGPKHENVLRSMLLNDDPGPEELYPFATDILWLNDYVVRSAIIQPVDRKYQHKRVYLFTFGGCMWYFLIGSEDSGFFRTQTLRKDGTLPIMWQNLAKLRIVQDFLVDHLRAESRRHK